MGAFISLSEYPFHGSLGRSRYPGKWDDQQVMSPTRVRFTPASGALSGVDTWFYYYRGLNNLISAGGVAQIGVKTAAVATFDGFNWNDQRAINPVIENDFPGAPAPVAGGLYNDMRAVVYDSKIRLFVAIYGNPSGSNRTAIFESVDGFTFTYVDEAEKDAAYLGRSIGAIANVGGTLVSLVSIANGAGGGNGRQKWVSTDGGLTWLERGLAIPVGTEGDWNGLNYVGGTMELIGDYYVALLHGMPFIGYRSGVTPYLDWPEAFGAFRIHVDDILTADVIWEANAQNPLFIAGPTHGATWHAALYQHNGSTFAHMETWGVPGFGNIGNATNMALRDTPYFGVESRVSSAQIYMLEMKDRGWLDNWTTPILADGGYTLRHVGSGKFVGIVSGAPVPVIDDEGEIAKFTIDRQLSYYRFRNGGVSMRAPSEFAGSTVVMEPSPGVLTNQAGQWDLTPWGDPVSGGGRHVVITNRYTRMALALTNGTEADGSPLVCLPFTGDPAQVFEIMPYRPSNTTTEFPDPENPMLNMTLPAGDLVGTTAHQIMTNKTLALAGHTGTIAQLITAAAAGDFDTLPDNSVVWAGGYPFVKQDGAAYDRLPVGFIPRIPSPFAFRAVCDGVVEVVGGEAVLTSGTDDTAAWQALFAYCNDAGVEPDCRGVPVVCVQCDIHLTTMQNVDFCGAKLRLIGGLFDPETINLTSTARTFLEVIDPDCPVVTGTATVDDANMVAGSLTPTLDFFTETGYCEIIADLTNGPWAANRQRTALESWRQAFAVVKEGVVVKPMARSMVGTGSVSYAYRRRSASGPVTIKNLQVDAELFNNQRIVRISRNDVRVENVCPAGNEYVESQNQLISVNYAAFIKITDCMGPSQGDPDESRASYFIHGSHCAEVTVEDSVSVGQPWGASGFNNVSGLYWRNPRMNRLDVHQAGFWIEVYGGTISQIGIGYGNGGGHLKVIGTTLVDCSVYHRPDWAGDFYGTIEVLSPSIMNSDYKAVVVDLHTKPLGSDLQSAQVPTVIVRDIHRLDTGLSASQITPIQIGLRAGAMALTPPQQFVVDGVTASSDYRCCNKICLEDMVAPGGASRLQVSFSNIIGALGYTDSSDFTLRVPATTTGGAGLKYDLRANNCHQVAFDTRNSPNARWYLSDLHTVGNYMADNCLSKQNDLTYGAPVILSGFTSSPVCGALTSGTFNFGSVVGGRVENAVSAWDFSNAKFIAGVVIPTSSTACVYPTGATREQMFSGWTPEMCGQKVMIRQSTDRSLTSTTSAQALFNEGGMSKVALAVGIYSFKLQFRIENMDGAASSNLRFNLKGAGTATLAHITLDSIGRDAANLISSAGAVSGIMSVTEDTLNLFNNAVSSVAGGTISGYFEVTSDGTIQPSVLLSVAAVATVKDPTTFECTKIASASVAGPWSA